jgi:hypothetical protein
LEQIERLGQAVESPGDVLGLDSARAQQVESTSAIVLSQRAARRRQRDDPIALPSTWVTARIAATAT